MKKVQEITVFSIGDSSELKTWSNVPYFFTKGLREKQIKVNAVNIAENKYLALMYKYSVYLITRLFYKHSQHTYFRSGLNYFLTNVKIRMAMKKFRDADAFVFLTYSFSSKKYSSKTAVLIGDWSYLYYILLFLKREPYWFENRSMNRELGHIDAADAVISLFPKSTVFNKQHSKSSRQHYLGHVINANYPLDKEQVLKMKLASNKFLFVGSRKYRQGLVQLINTFKDLRSGTDMDAELHIVGFTQEEINIIQPGLFYHGYLNKGIESENSLYYQLMYQARAIVNTNAGWGSFSAITEAMFYYTPVITTPYPEFKETYGNDIDFGFYVNANSRQELKLALQKMLQHGEEAHLKMMANAHEKVKDFTWGNYCDKVLAIISNTEQQLI